MRIVSISNSSSVSINKIIILACASLIVAIFFGIFFSSNTSASMGNPHRPPCSSSETEPGDGWCYGPYTYDAGSSNATAWYNDWCGKRNDATYSMAEYLWISPRGSRDSNRILVDPGQDPLIPISINYSGRYCGYDSKITSAKATDIKILRVNGARYPRQEATRGYSLTFPTAKSVKSNGGLFSGSIDARLDIGNLTEDTYKIKVTFNGKTNLDDYKAPEFQSNIKIESRDLPLTTTTRVTDRVNHTNLRTTMTASPGDMVYFTHVVKNSGDYKISNNRKTLERDYRGSVTTDRLSDFSIAAKDSNTYEAASSSSRYNLRIPANAKAGQTFCQRFIIYNDFSKDTKRSDPACVRVVIQPPQYNYELTPSVDTDKSGIVEPDTTVKVTPDLGVSGSTTTEDTQWEVSQMIVPVGRTIPGKANSPRAPCGSGGYYNTTGINCTNIARGTAKFNQSDNFISGTNPLRDWSVLLNYPIGTKICFAFSVQPRSSSSNDWAHSEPTCVTIGKNPKVQVLGGDLIVGRSEEANIVTSTSLRGTTYYGSWSEYAIIPSGNVEGMASASGYAGGMNTDNLCNGLSLLTFTNANSATTPVCDNSNVGGYSIAAPSQFNAVVARLVPTTGVAPLNGAVRVQDLQSRTIYSGVANGTINLSASASGNVQIPAGKWVVINAPNTDVRITSNIKYTDGAIGRIGDIPQLVIIAKNIIINDNVDTVDAWLFANRSGADGVITTCDAPNIVEPAGLTAGVCAARLTVNGPVVANRLNLYRTAGSGTGTDAGKPAEVFNLRPDAYLWASSFSGDNPKARTVLTTELPPRF